MQWPSSVLIARSELTGDQLRPSKGKALGLMIAASAAFWVVAALIADALV